MNNDRDITYRIDWIDVCKGIAIIFIYLGHWTTPNGRVEGFAYSFHLQLFFIISGFFAIKHREKSKKVFIFNQIEKLFIPFVFWAIINIIYFDMQEKKTIIQLITNFTTLFTDYSNVVSPQLWFLPTLFTVSIVYYFLLKVLKKPIYILGISYLLYMVQVCLDTNPIGQVILKPFIVFFGISAVPTYLLWYAIGTTIFPTITKCMKVLEGEKCKKKSMLILLGVFVTLITWLFFAFKVDFFWASMKPGKLSDLMNIKFIYQNYRMIATLIICITIMFISYVLRKSTFLLELGKNTLSLMGLEFMAKNFVTFTIFTVFNLGIPTLNNESTVIFYVVLTILFAKVFIKPLNKHIPYLIGK